MFRKPDEEDVIEAEFPVVRSRAQMKGGGRGAILS